MTATSRPGVPSAGSNGRPRMRLTPRASKYRGPTFSTVTISGFDPGGADFPSIDSCRAAPPNIGRLFVTLAPTTVLTVFSRSSMRRRNSLRICGLLYFRVGSRKFIVKRRDVSMPTSTRYKFIKLRIMNPAPASSTIVSASSTTTRAAVQRRARRPPDPERPASFNTSLTLVFEMCSAGARPKTIPVRRHTTPKKAKTLPSISNAIQYGLPTF